MNNSEFLEKYHQMVNDTINAPKIIKNMKQGDSIWYLKYVYKANNGQKVSLKLNHYEVSELSEYRENKGSDPFDVRSFYVHVFRDTHKMTIYSTDASIKTGVWEDKFESDSLGLIADSYLRDINKETYAYDGEWPYYTLEIYGYDKNKVLETLREYKNVLCKNDSNRIEKFIESQLKKKPVDETSKFNVLTDDEVTMYYNHPSCKNILRWFQFSWNNDLSREENVLNFLKFVMIIGGQKLFREKLNTERQIKTSDGVIDLNEVAKNGTKKELNEAIEYIEDNGLIQDIEWKIKTGWTHYPIYLVYKNKNDRFVHRDIVTINEYSRKEAIFYKKLCAIVKKSGDNVVIKTSKEDIIDVLTSEIIYNPLININNL